MVAMDKWLSTTSTGRCTSDSPQGTLGLGTVVNTHGKHGGFQQNNGWFIKENAIKVDDIGVTPFMETPTS